MIPTRVYINGDLVSGRKLIGFGRKRLNDLKKDMSFFNLNTGSNRTRLSDGTVILTTMSFGLSEVTIITSRAGGQAAEKYFDCQCYPCMTLGVIVADTGSGVYDVALCAGKGEDYAKFIIFPGVKSAGWEDYSVDQIVFVAGMCETGCSTDVACLTSRLGNPEVPTGLDNLVIIPVYNSIDMRKEVEVS